jgi:hypothetical protein
MLAVSESGRLALTFGAAIDSVRASVETFFVLTFILIIGGRFVGVRPPGGTNGFQDVSLLKPDSCVLEYAVAEK